MRRKQFRTRPVQREPVDRSGAAVIPLGPENKKAYDHVAFVFGAGKIFI